jgi:hypothetical protein
MIIARAIRFEKAMPIDPDAPKFWSRLLEILLERELGCVDPLILGFLRRLPDEEIWRNRRAEDRYQRGQKIG